MSFKRSNDWTMEELEALPRTRGKAYHLGQRYYFSGRLCKHKHISARTLDEAQDANTYATNVLEDNPKSITPSQKQKNWRLLQNTLEHFLFISASRAKRRNIVLINNCRCGCARHCQFLECHSQRMGWH